MKLTNGGSASPTDPTTPLADIVVLEIGDCPAVAVTGRILADLGATVVKLEPPDQTSTASEPSAPHSASERSALHSASERSALHGNKRSLRVTDVDCPVKHDCLNELITSADVIIEAREGSRVSTGCQHWDVNKPVRCRVSAFGVDDINDIDWPGEDVVVQALSGCMDLTGHPGGPPVEMGIPLADISAGIYAALGVLGGLLTRQSGRESDGIEVAKLDASVAMLSYMAVGYFADGRFPSRVGTGHAGIVPYNAFRVADGEIVVAPFTQRFWRNFCQAIGRPDLAQSEQYRDFSARVANKTSLMAQLDPILLRRSLASWLELFTEHDVPAGPVLDVRAALALEQTRERGLIHENRLPDGTLERRIGPPFHFHDVCAQPARTSQHPAGGTLPLSGVRVLDLTRMFAGPCSSQVLADLGAEVIKVEEPRVGDPTRRNIPFWGGESAYFMSINRGKKSVCIDLKTDQGKEAVLGLLRTADVVMENYRPGVMGRLGLDHTALHRDNPSLIMASLSGFGATGPLRDKISFDLVNQAMAGLIDLTGDPEDRPVRLGVPVGDMAGGLYMAIGILAALYRRRVTGRGSWLDLSLHDVLLDLLGPLGQQALCSDQSVTRAGSRDRVAGPRGVFRAKDGWLVISATTDKTFAGLIGVLGLDPLADEQRFGDPVQRKTHETELEPILAGAVSTWTALELAEQLCRSGVVAAPVLSLKEAVESPLALDRGLATQRSTRAWGPCAISPLPSCWMGAASEPERCPPCWASTPRNC
jgi:crotonobetainyl-CoA:carnitine CoA-transferase CaiB-like acyl-CoA transferase